MRPRFAALTLAVVAAASVATHGSDPNAVYARVDRVVLEPNADAPQRAQIWGVFTMATPNDANLYLAPVRGYLYFIVGENPSAAQKEWADLAGLAGSGQIVSFGSRWQLKARVRNPDAKPMNPDAYTVNTGVTRVRGNTDYAPIRALLDFRP